MRFHSLPPYVLPFWMICLPVLVTRFDNCVRCPSQDAVIGKDGGQVHRILSYGNGSVDQVTKIPHGVKSDQIGVVGVLRVGVRRSRLDVEIVAVDEHSASSNGSRKQMEGVTVPIISNVVWIRDLNQVRFTPADRSHISIGRRMLVSTRRVERHTQKIRFVVLP